jgi:hypothetical protein
LNLAFGEEGGMREEVAARLAGIGPYTIEAEDHEFIYFWERLPELACGWTKFDLVFALPPEEREPDERMFALWEWYRGRHPSHAAWFRREEIVPYFQNTWVPGAPRVGLSDEELRKGVLGATVRVFWQTTDPEDLSHGVDVCLRFVHPYGDKIRTWIEESSSWEYTR